VLALDEPTSQLDPQGADDVLAALGRLNADLGTTVVLAEHRLERAAPLADRAAVMDAGRVTALGPPPSILAGYAGAPPVTHLGRLLGWDPLPLTVRDARARAAASPEVCAPDRTLSGRAHKPASTPGRELVRGMRVSIELGGRAVLHGVDVDVREGEVVALLGRNGAGKTTLLRALAGLQGLRAGTVVRATGAAVAYVPQDPGSMLFAPTVRREVAETLRLLAQPDDGRVDGWLARLGLTALSGRHPRSLSSGERQRVAIAAVAIGGAPVLLLDEPTRGIDAQSRDALAVAIGEHASSGGAVVLATHDIELAARVAHRVVVLGDGDVVAAGDARDVLAGSLFAPQVLRVLPPFLTVDEVAAAVAETQTEAQA
jgi:energy-coupling factor transport system ATP-binding protein